MTTLYPFITRLEVDVNGFCTQRNNKQVRASHRFGTSDLLRSITSCRICPLCRFVTFVLDKSQLYIFFTL